jgi:hypothetical protein
MTLACFWLAGWALRCVCQGVMCFAVYISVPGEVGHVGVHSIVRTFFGGWCQPFLVGPVALAQCSWAIVGV